MKPFITSYGRIEQKNSTTLVVTENDTGLYVSFNIITQVATYSNKKKKLL